LTFTSSGVTRNSGAAEQDMQVGLSPFLLFPFIFHSIDPWVAPCQGPSGLVSPFSRTHS